MSITLADFLSPLKTQNVQVVVKDLNLNNLAKLYADTIASIDTKLSERTVNRWDIIRHNMVVVYLDDNGDTPIIPVESVTINETSVQISLDGMVELIATVLPEDATDKTVSWISSDEAVATVENGVVTAVSEGTVLIYASAGDVISDACQVTVSNEIIHVESIKFEETAISLNPGTTAFLAINILPENATDKTVTWISGDETIATVEDGVVHALAEGSTIITVTTTDGGYSDNCLITVSESVIQVESVTLNQNIIDVEIGSDSIILEATVLPEDATDKTVTWASSDESVATVENGIVSFIGVGQADITASAGDVVSEPCVVTVSESSIVHVESVTLSDSTLTLELGGEPATITATILPEDATDKNLVWHSSDENVVTVEDGVITIVGEGNASITATADNITSEPCEVSVVGM